MKANEAPEKVYVYIPDDDIVGTASIQKGFPHQFVTDEYVRKDAFIEKACYYLFSHMGLFVTFFDDDIVEDIERSEFIKKFRIAMEDKL
jgi:hypothetical protein